MPKQAEKKTRERITQKARKGGVTVIEPDNKQVKNSNSADGEDKVTESKNANKN